MVQAISLLPLAPLMLRLFNLRRSDYSSHASAVEPLESIRDRAERTARAVALASRIGCFRGTCLHRALVVWVLLWRQGIESRLRFGVLKRQDGTPFEAHAWVELGGVPLNEQPEVLERYSVLEGSVEPQLLRMARDDR